MTSRRHGPRRHYALGVWLGLPLLVAQPQTVDAQPTAAPVHVRATVALATMVSEDQTQRLGFDSLGFVGDVQLGYALSPWLDVRLGASAGGFAAETGTGGLLQPQLGAAVAWPGMGLRPWLQLDTGVGFTGALARPVFRVGAGLDVPVSDSLSLAPVLGYWQLFQWDGPLYSTDARFVWFGVVVGFRPVSQRPVIQPREHIITHERWIEHPPPAPPEPPAPEKTEPPPAVEPSPELLMLIESTLPPQQQEWLAPVLFAYDSDVLEPQGVAMLHEVALELQRRPQLKLLEIRGYADARGSQQYNVALSERRARAVLEWLVAHGIARERLTLAAHGAAEFVEQGADEPAHAQNRRVIFRVLKTEERPQ